MVLAKKWVIRKGKRMDEFEAVGEVAHKIRARIGRGPDPGGGDHGQRRPGQKVEVDGW